MVVVGSLGLLMASIVAHGTRAANPKLIATVNDNYTISLTDTNSTAVTTLTPGTYDIEVHDNSAIHNFDLKGPDGMTVDKTTVGGVGTVTWTVTLTNGTWTFVCDAHPYDMNGSFTVSNSATTTATTATSSTMGTTTPATTVATTVPPPTTTIVGPPPPPATVRVVVKCGVPRLRGKTVAAARGLLRRRHCALGSVRRAYSARMRPGIIIGQTPAAGARRARDARVSVTVSRGPRR